MIKVNLQENMLGGDDLYEEEVESNLNIRAVLFIGLKSLFFIIFLMGVYFYEQQGLDFLGGILNKEKALEATIKQKISKKTQEVKELRRTKSKYINLKEQVFMAKDIMTLRLIFFNAMIALNTSRSKTLWFKQVSYGKNLLSIQGYAINKKDLDEFLANIKRRKGIFKTLFLRESRVEKIKNTKVRFFSLEMKLLD